MNATLLASDDPEPDTAAKTREQTRRRIERELVALAAILAILGAFRARIVVRMLQTQTLTVAGLNALRQALNVELATLLQRLGPAIAASWRAAAEAGDADALADGRAALGAEGTHLSQGVSMATADFAAQAASDVAAQIVAQARAGINRILGVGAVGNSVATDVAVAIGSVPEGALKPTGFLGKLSTQAELAHRIESGTIYEMASRDRMKTIAAESPYEMTKTWVSVLIPTTRPDHRAANGQTVAVDAQFNVGGNLCDGPMDPDLPVEQVANCLCGTKLGRGPRKAAS